LAAPVESLPTVDLTCSQGIVPILLWISLWWSYRAPPTAAVRDLKLLQLRLILDGDGTSHNSPTKYCPEYK
jgi:hypothetical protein